MQRLYRAHIQHLGDGEWRVVFDEYQVTRETETRWYYKKNGYKNGKYTYGFESWFNKGAKNSVFETKEEAIANLLFRRKRMQSKLEYRLKYNTKIIELLNVGVIESPLPWQ